MPKTDGNIRFFETREDWRMWLTENFEIATEIWFMFPLKSSGMTGITYNDAVEEALCFDWIDSTTKAYSDVFRVQRFTPRNPKSSYSQPNKERLKWLLEHNMIHPKFEKKIQKIISEPFIFPPDIMDKLKADKEVWANYQRFSEGYKRIRIAYIEAARVNNDEFTKRLNNFIVKTKQNKKIMGFGGIDKYYR